jgi:hypothetical protein
MEVIMKVICIDDEISESLKNLFIRRNKIHEDYLTKDKMYDVIEITEPSYNIIDNNGDHTWYAQRRFITIKQARKLKLEQIQNKN